MEDVTGGSAAPGGARVVLEVIDEAECLALLARSVVGRVGVTVGAVPAIFPVNYAMLGTTIVFRTAAGTKLQAALGNAVVAFEVDDVEENRTGGWTVLVVGVARELTGSQFDAALKLPLDQWAPEGSEQIVGIDPHIVSGRRLVRTS